MSGEIRMTKKTIISIILGVFVVAFLGVISGNWIAGQGNVSADQGDLFRKYYSRLGILKKGMAVPPVEVVDRGGNARALTDITVGKKTIILFISVGCDACTNTIEDWSNLPGEFPPDLQIIGINNGDCAPDEKFITHAGKVYPLYRDTAYALALKYNIDQFPSILGVDEDGQITFLGAGVYPELTPIEANKIISSRN